MSPHPCFVYVLGTVGQTVPGDIRTYVGWSNDIAARLSKHNAGDGAKSTRGRQWQLLYAELFFTRGDAMSRISNGIENSEKHWRRIGQIEKLVRY